MTPEQMREKSGKKINQIIALMETLHVRVEARQRIMENGFLDNTIFWIDDEQYPRLPEVPTSENVEAPVNTPDDKAA